MRNLRSTLKAEDSCSMLRDPALIPLKLHNPRSQPNKMTTLEAHQGIQNDNRACHIDRKMMENDDEPHDVYLFNTAGTKARSRNQQCKVSLFTTDVVRDDAGEIW